MFKNTESKEVALQNSLTNGIECKRKMTQLLLNATEKIDKQFRLYYRPLIVLLCIFAFVNFSRVDYVLSQSWNGWAIGDWLLNYEGGFIRRGLLGTFLISVGSSLGMPLNHLIYGVQCAVFLLFLLIFIYLIRNKTINFWYLVLCFSPGFLLFNYYDGMSVGRKEILIYALFGFWCVIHERSGPRSISVVFFSLLIFLLTLTHEMAVFFMPYFMLVGFLSYPINSRQDLFKIIAPGGASLIAVAILLLFAHPISSSSMCRVFIELGANENVCVGIISFGSDVAIGTIWQRLAELDLIAQLGWGGFLLLAVAPIYLALASFQHQPVSRTTPIIIAALLLGGTTPLFLLSIDWGRWVAIHITLSAIFIASRLPRTAPVLKCEDTNGSRRHVFTNLGSSNPVILLIVVLAVLIFDLSYSINHCCTNNLIEPFGPLKKLITTLKI